MTIRHETSADYQDIETLIYRAFLNHRHHPPRTKPVEHLIVRRLRNAGVLSLSLVAEITAGIVGHIAFSPVTIGQQQANWYGLGPVAVSLEEQGKGIGSALITAGMTILQKQGADGFVLLGEPKYYSRFGFMADNRLVLRGYPPEYFLCHSLIGDDIPTGLVAYHSAFE